MATLVTRSLKTLNVPDSFGMITVKASETFKGCIGFLPVFDTEENAKELFDLPGTHFIDIEVVD